MLIYLCQDKWVMVEMVRLLLQREKNCEGMEMVCPYTVQKYCVNVLNGVIIEVVND